MYHLPTMSDSSAITNKINFPKTWPTRDRLLCRISCEGGACAVFPQSYMHACIHTCMHACMHGCMHGCMHECMYVGMYVCMHVCMHACMHVCMYVCAYIFVFSWKTMMILGLYWGKCLQCVKSVVSGSGKWSTNSGHYLGSSRLR